MFVQKLWAASRLFFFRSLRTFRRARLQGALIILIVICIIWRQVRPEPRLSTAALHTAAADSGAFILDTIFVTDCSEYQEWLAQVFLSQWGRSAAGSAAGVRLTRLLACDETDPRLHRAKKLMAEIPEVSLFILPELNGQGKERYLCRNRPYGLHRWLQARPPLSSRHWVALVDPDMLVMRPMGVMSRWRITGGALGQGPRVLSLQDVPPRVALAHNFPFVAQVWKDINLSLSTLCEGAPDTLLDCEGRIRNLWDDDTLISREYAVGVPHIIRAQDLQSMAIAWEFFTDRVRLQYRGWTAEMFSWLISAHYAGVRFAYLAEVVTDPAAAEVAWGPLEAAHPEMCSDTLPHSIDVLPWVLHFCEVYNISYKQRVDSIATDTLHLDKRVVGKVLKALAKEEGRNISSLLDCDAPLFRLPPADLADRRPTGKRAAPADLFYRSSWMLCAVLRSINTGLREVRERTCPQGTPLGGEVETLEAAPATAQLASMLLKSLDGIGKKRRPEQQT